MKIRRCRLVFVLQDMDFCLDGLNQSIDNMSKTTEFFDDDRWGTGDLFAGVDEHLVRMKQTFHLDVDQCHQKP